MMYLKTVSVISAKSCFSKTVMQIKTEASLHFTESVLEILSTIQIDSILEQLFFIMGTLIPLLLN